MSPWPTWLMLSGGWLFLAGWLLVLATEGSTGAALDAGRALMLSSILPLVLGWSWAVAEGRLMRGPWPSRMLVGSGLLFSVGLVLVFASGGGGTSTTGWYAVWQAGGLMIYLALPLFALGMVLSAIRGIRAVVRLRQRRA